MAEKEKEEWGETVKVVATDNSDEWGETVVVDPKSTAPSTKGGESGALVRPLTPTSASEGSELESWTQTINPFADKGAVKPTQQAGATQAPKAKLLKVIPSSEKKSPELLKARVDTYGDMYKRAMDRAYTLKQSVEGVDNELKNSKAYVDSNPNDQNAINSYNALISKRNEMAEMARMEIARADVWQKGIEKTQLEIDDSLTASESISNSISNMATQIKGSLPASGLAISTLENKIQQGVLYVAGKLMGADDETASKVSVLASQNLPSAGILGTTQKEARQFYTERLGELEKEQKPTKSIIKTFEEGDVVGLGAAILDGGSSILSSVITSAPTGGVGIFTEMMGRSVYDSNNEKAKRLKISVDELYDRGLDEAAVPLAIGAVSASLEKIGLDGISKAINKKIGSKALKDIFEIILESSKEAGTEWLQTGAEEYNKALARGMNAEQAGEVALSKMLSEEGREAALKGAAGSGVSIATGRAAKSLYGMAKSNRDKLYQDLAKVETLARERANPNLSSEALSSIDREINNTTANMQKEVLDQLNRRANLTEENASLVEGIEANVKTISDDIESKKLLSEDPSLSDDAKIIIDLEIADLEAKRLDLAAQSEEIIKNNRPIELKKNTSPTSDKYGTINRNDGKGVVDLTKEEFEAEQAKMQPKVDEQVTPTAEGEQVPKTKEEIDAEVERLNKEKEDEIREVKRTRGLIAQQTLIPEIEAKYNTQITELEKQYEKEPTKKEDGKPMSGGVQGVRPEGQAGKESAELRTEEEKVADPLKDVESTAKALEGVTNEQWESLTKTTEELLANEKDASEIYHKAKKDGSNPQLVKAVEQLLGKPKEATPQEGSVVEGESAELRPEEEEVSETTKALEGKDITTVISPTEINSLNKQLYNDLLNKQSELLSKGIKDFKNNPEWNAIKDKISFSEAIINNDSKAISEAYHKAKADGSNPQLVEAVEQLLGKPKEATPQEGSVVGGEVKSDELVVKKYSDKEIKRQLDEQGYETKNKTAKELRDLYKKEIGIDEYKEPPRNNYKLKVVSKKQVGGTDIRLGANSSDRSIRNNTEKYGEPTFDEKTNEYVWKTNTLTLWEMEDVETGKKYSVFGNKEYPFSDIEQGQPPNYGYIEKPKFKNGDIFEVSANPEINEKYGNTTLKNVRKPKSVEQSLKEQPKEEEKVSGGLTQEEKVNLENISKDAGVNFQEVRNVYNKYGEGKPLNEITLEDYQKAEEKRQGEKKVKAEGSTPKVEEEKPKIQLPKTRKERLDSLREKAKKLKEGKPIFFSKKPKEKIISSQEDIEKNIIDEMNNMELVNQEINLSEATSEQQIDVEELNSRLDTPLESVNWEDYEGVPFGFTISDQLRSGDAKNTYTGETIKDLKGGIGFNGTAGNKNKAWANTTKDEADSMYEKANSIYEKNKPLFEKLWAEGKLPQGVIPFAVVKMAESSILSNEAVFRTGIQNIETLPKQNREAAVVALKKELERKIEKESSDLKRGTVLVKDKKTGEMVNTKEPYSSNTLKQKKKAIGQYQNILNVIKTKGYKDIVDVLKNKTDFALPEKAIIANEIFYGNPTPIGGKEISIERSRPSTPVSLALIGDKSPALINIAKITDMLTEPSMKDVPNMHIVSIVGVKVADKVNNKWTPAGGSVKTNHPNYKHGVEGQSIGILKNPVHMKDAFGEAYGSAISQVVKNEAEGNSISSKSALSQGVPVQSGLPNRTFISAIGRKALDNVDKLNGFLRQAFPSTTFFTSQEAWDAAMQDPDVYKKLQDGDVVYAFTKNGNVFINPNLKTTKAALHEVGHIWMDFIKENNPKLFEKGLKLVEGTQELKNAIAQYGDNLLAREEALMEIMSTKGDNIVNAAQKAKVKEWLLSVWKYVSEKFESLRGLTPKQIEDLTLDKFVEGVLSDILSGKEITAKSIKGETKFSKTDPVSDFISSSIEEGYALDEVSEIVQEMWGKSEIEANELIDKYKSTKTTEDAKKQQSGQMREQGVQDQPQRKGDSDMPIINEAELQDGEAVEEVEEEGLPKLTKEQQIEAERRSLNEPKNVSDLAKIFNKILGLSPKESVMAARLFDVKAKNMSELLGITKDEYYQRYWFTGEQEGGLSQMTLPDGREVTVKRMSPEVVNGFYSPIEKNLMEYGKDKIKAKDWLNVVGKGDEAVFTGVRAFLEGKDPNAMVSKQEILDYMKDNRISVVEVVKGGVKSKGMTAREAIKKLEQGFDVYYMPNDDSSEFQVYEIEDTDSQAREYFLDGDFEGVGEPTKFSQYQLEGEKENYKEVLVTLPSKVNEKRLQELIQKKRDKTITEKEEAEFKKLDEQVAKDFQSSHFNEPNILVHLRMNTRTDADGNKVLFLEEVQSDWGQLGKKEGFELSKEEKQKLIEEHKGVLAQLQDIDAKIIANVESGNKDRSAYDLAQQKIKLQEKSEELKDKIFKTKPPTAPFVMDTNAWTKLGLKVALKEAVAQGVDKIAWTTGEQQNDRYDLSKQVDAINWTKLPNGNFDFTAVKDGAQQMGDTDVSISKLADYVGKDVAEKIIEQSESRKYGTLSGVDLKVGGKGMKGFYGSMEEGTKGIVGGVAEKLFGRKVGETKIGSKATYTTDDTYVATDGKAQKLYSKVGDKFLASISNETANGFSSKDLHIELVYLANKYSKQNVTISTQPSVYITPELKAQVQEGLPLFQERRGAWSKIAASAKRIISMYDKARLDTAVHEILGHDFLDEIISLSATNKEFEQDLNTIIDEYIKSSGNKTSKATLLNELKNFNVESNNQSVNARAIHEWFSRTAEGYFMGETNIKPDSKLAKTFEQFRQYLTDLFNTMTSRNYIIPSEPMKQIFRKAFGAENFDFVNDYAEANIMEGKLDVLRITENEIPQSRLDKFKKLREAKRGLGQEEDVDIDELVDAARYLSTDPTVNVFSVVDELVSMYPQKEEYIRKHSKTFEKVFVAEDKKVRETARSVYESEVVSPEMKQRAATIEDLFSYTPEKLQEKMEDVESLIADYSIDDLMAFFATSNEIPFKEYPLFLAAMQKRISRAINELDNSNQGQSAAKQKLLNYEMTIMDRYIAEGTATGQRLNYFKVLKNMSTDGKLRFFKRKFKEESGNAVKEFQDLISNLRKERDKAYKDNDYFLEENLSLEQRIEDLEAELAKERSTKAKNDKRKDRESLSQAKPPKRKISQSELNDILKELGSAGLGQSLEDLNAALKLGFYIIQDKPKTIEQFTRDWNKITKQNKTQEELSQVYRDVRKYATENEGVDIDYFDSDAMIQSSIDSFNERASQKKNLAKKELDSDIAKAEKEAMKTQMSEKDKEVKAKEALKKREKEIRDNFLDSLSQDGLWQQYVKSVSGRILGNLGSKLGAKQSEKALLDEFTELATKELNKAIDELMPKQKGGKAATPNYAQQLGDLIANQEKLADIFDKAVKDFAEKNKGNANAQSVLSKLKNGLKNPFSEKLMENALEKEAQNYAIKIGDLAFKYAGLRQNLKYQIVAQIVAETGLTGQQAAQLEQDLRAKFDNIIAETEQDTAGQLAKAILSNAKKELGLGKKQQDYVKELLGYLKNKAKDYYKTTNKQALVDPFEQLKYAVEMLNDANGRKIWDDSKAELIAKIDSDKDLSQQEKDDLKAYLDDYQNAIFDQLLSKNKLFNNVKKVLAEESPFVKKDGSVDWNGIIIQAKGNVEIAKQIILDSVADKLQGYSGSQVNSVIDAIGREYQRRINEKRAEIIEKQLKDISDKKVIFKKKIATGFVQKLVEMENSGALGDQRFEQALKEWIGFSDMTPDKWNRLRELIVDAEEAPEGNERDRAIENLSAYIKFNKIGKFAEIYASAYYAGLLARPTTIIKNSTGIIEPLLTLFYKSFTDRNYAKAMLQGLKRGDAADIWGGGLVQGGKLDEEVGNDGLPRVNMLKQWRMQQKGIIPKLFALGAKPLDLLSMADALSQAMVERGAEYEFYARYLLEKNKEDIRNGVQGVAPITEKEARRIAIKRLSDDAMLDWAFAQAEDEFASRKIVPSSARLNRRAYEIVSESLLPTSVRELAQNLALEESYKSKLISFRGMTSQTRAQKRLETNYGVATFLGSFAKGIVDLLGEGGGYVAGATTKVLPVTEARRNQIRNSVERAISMRVLPFARGISNVVEKSLEKTPYGIVSGVVGATAEKLSYGKPKTIDEILQHQYMMNRNKAKIAKSATSMIIGSAIYYTLLSASKEWDDEEEKEGRYHLPTGFYSAGETVRFGKNKIERYTLPVNCVVLYGRIIPLSLFGTVGIGSMITAQAYDNFLSKEKKKQGAVVDPDNPESIKGFSSFVSSSGNAILNMSAMQSISELQESVSSKGTMDFGDYASKLSVKSIALPIPFSGTANQIIQGARYLSGDKTAQAAIGADEKIYKELGLAGIVYNRPVLDWRGRPVNAVLQNQEGIASFVSMLDKRPLDKIDMYLLKELEFNPVIDKRLSDNFADLNMVGMSKDEYYDYTKNVGRTVNNYIEAYFDKIKDYQIPQDKIDELAAEGKTQADLEKQLKTIKKTFVSDFLNIAEQEHMLNYQFKKGIIKEAYEAKVRANNDRLENLIEKINDKGE